MKEVLARLQVKCIDLFPAAVSWMEENHTPRTREAAWQRSFDFWHPDNVAPLVAYLCSDAAAHISGKVFGIQGDAVELYQPWTSVAVIENDDERWTPEDLSDRINDLFDESSIEPGPENGMARLRYSITTRATL